MKASWLAAGLPSKLASSQQQRQPARRWQDAQSAATYSIHSACHVSGA